MQPEVITVDGLSGSGKGTISLLLAKHLGWHYLDSGALYRVLAHYACLKGLELGDEDKLSDLAVNLPVSFKQNNENGNVDVFLQDSLVTKDVRTEECGYLASKIAVLKKVRIALLELQRGFLQEPGLVADGRDMGTVVFTQAKYKFFLEASAKERASRRCKQLKEIGVSVNLHDLIGEITARDEQDRNRAVAPMKPAKDAMVIDTTALSIDAVFERIIRVVNF